MKWLMTGATGFIGGHLINELSRQGEKIVALVRNESRAGGLPTETEILKGDLSIFDDSDRQLPPVDIVVHLAGVVTAPSESVYAEVNCNSVGSLISCIEGQDWQPRRFLFASSLAAAGPSPEDRPWKESDVLHPIDPYGAAKAAAEDIVRSSQIPSTIFRPPIVLGPGDPATLTLFRSAQAGVGMAVYGRDQRLSFVDVRDLVQAIIKMGRDERAGSYTYYTSFPDEIDTPKLWSTLGRVLGRRVRVARMPKGLLRVAMHLSTFGSKILSYKNQLDEKQYLQIVAPAFVCSSEALRSELAWDPKHNFEDTVRHAVEGYRKSGMLT